MLVKDKNFCVVYYKNGDGTGKNRIWDSLFNIFITLSGLRKLEYNFISVIWMLDVSSLAVNISQPLKKKKQLFNFKNYFYSPSKFNTRKWKVKLTKAIIKRWWREKMMERKLCRKKGENYQRMSPDCMISHILWGYKTRSQLISKQNSPQKKQVWIYSI